VGKNVCPIISGNPRYFGLTQIEWAISLFAFFFITLLPAPMRYIGYAVWGIGVIAYPKLSKKFEENFVAVLLESMKIPATLIGHFRRAVPPVSQEENSGTNNIL